MSTLKNTRDDILFNARKLQHSNELLIVQCERWLPAEEGNRNMEKRIMERERKKRMH